MTRGEIITRFRQENPEITTNVATDSVLQSWAEIGNTETAVKARLIRGATEFSAIASKSAPDDVQYNLITEINNFYDIDEYPGGGVSYNDKRLTLTTPSQLDADKPGWRTASSGTPTRYYRRNQYINLDPTASGTSTIRVYTVLQPDDLDDNTKEPFNELEHLRPFHYALVLYLKMRAFAGKVKKPETSMTAQQEYESYTKWMLDEVNRNIYQDITLRPPTQYRG